MSHMGGFDTLAPLSSTGARAPGSDLTLDRLLTISGDEMNAYYGDLAEGLAVSADRRSIAFKLRAEARWHDGVPITSADVAYTMETIKSDPFAAGLPDVLGWIARIEVLNDREFILHTHADVTPANFTILNFMTILPAHYWKGRDPRTPDLVPHLGSGPYRVADFDPGRNVRYVRVPDYWGRDTPPNRGRYNFDVLRYEVYRDATVAREAFRKGLFDYWVEQDLRHWMSSYDTPARARGWLVKGRYYLRIEIGVRLMLSWNTRRVPFDDRRVREALTYAMDFDWQNRALHWGLHERAQSHFPNTPFAATGLPDAAELALLEPFRDALPPELFTAPFTLPKSPGTGRNRAGLERARALLEEAGLAGAGRDARQRGWRALGNRVPVALPGPTSGRCCPTSTASRSSASRARFARSTTRSTSTGGGPSTSRRASATMTSSSRRSSSSRGSSIRCPSTCR